MRKCFKFAKENSSSLGIVYRPIAKVGLKDVNGDMFELSTLVDSGADITNPFEKNRRYYGHRC